MSCALPSWHSRALNSALRARPCCRRATICAPIAFHHVNSEGGSPHARILRYTDGHERRILYPAPVDAVDEEGAAAQASAADACGYDGDWDRSELWSGWDKTYDLRHGTPSHVAAAPSKLQPQPDTTLPSLSQSTSSSSAADVVTGVPHTFPPHGSTAAGATASMPTPQPSISENWKAPADILRAKEASHHQLKGRYQVLLGCPWPVPRPLAVLALHSKSKGDGLASIYTLRTRLGGMSTALSQALGTRLASRIEYSQIKDGVVAFETLEDAKAFAQNMEADEDVETTVVELDSHMLFRSAADALGVVVYIPAVASSNDAILPHQLATALRGQRSWDQLS